MNTTMDKPVSRKNWGPMVSGWRFTALCLYSSYGIYLSHGMPTDTSVNVTPVGSRIIDCQVSPASVNSATRSGINQTYFPRSTYEHHVGGQAYRSSPFSYLSSTNSGPTAINQVMERYPAGSVNIGCFDPGKPSKLIVVKSVRKPLCT